MLLEQPQETSALGGCGETQLGFLAAFGEEDPTAFATDDYVTRCRELALLGGVGWAPAVDSAPNPRISAMRPGKRNRRLRERAMAIRSSPKPL